MRTSISFIALGVALFGGVSAAQAQTVITRDISGQPVETIITQQPVQTVQTTETVRTIRPASKSTVRRQTVSHQVVTTRRTVVSQRVVPAQTMVAPPPAGTTVAAYPQPRYDTAAPLYDTVAPVPAADDTIVGAPAAVSTAPVYRYVYEPDRILVIDPVTNIAVQALPR